MDDHEELYAATLNPTDDFNLVESDDPHVKTYTKRAPAEVEWFHGKMSREEASTLLSAAKPGSYLVRESLRSVGDFGISFRVSSGVKHFKVIADDYGDFFIADNRFGSLAEVVEFYCNEFLCEDRCLEHPTPPRDSKASSTKARKAVLAVYDYEAQSPDEISFGKGDRLSVLNDDDEHWLWCSLRGGGIAGFVPRAMVQDVGVEASEREAAAACQLAPHMHRSRWIYGKISRQEAEELLQQDGQTGSFLIRESTSPIGDYSLSFRGPRKIQHFKIHVDDQQRYECGGRQFDCLEAIVLRYTKEPLMDETSLLFPLPPPQMFTDADVDGDLYSDVQLNTGKKRATASASASKKPSKAPPKPMTIYERTLRPASTSSAATAATAGSAPTATAGAKPGAPGGYLKMGHIVKKTKAGKKWKPMFFALLGAKKRLYYFDNEHAVKPRGIIDLSASMVYPLHDSFFGRPNCFQMIVSGSEAYLCCDTEADRDDWVAHLSQYCAYSGIGKATDDPAKRYEILGLQLSIMEAKDFGKHALPYCTVSLNGIKQARVPAKKDAFWGEEFFFDNISEDIQDFSIELLNRGKRKDVYIANLKVPLASMKINEGIDKWTALTGEGATGSLRFKATFMKEAVLPLAEYSDLKKVLFEEDIGATLAMAEANRSQLNETARNLLRIWRADHGETAFLTRLNERVISEEERPATLFRGNTLATKAMDQYMKMIAIPFLHKAISYPVRCLFEDKRSCELDPTRKGKPENLKVLLEHVSKIVGGIFDTIDECPSELRYVLSNLSDAVKIKWPTEKLVPFTAVSAFLFLRLFCPAIMNPKLFNMMPDHPTEEIARNLTLVAKVIQNLANMTEFGQKEAFMLSCNEFIMVHRGKMQAYMSSVASIAPGNNAPTPVDSSARAMASIYRFCSMNEASLAKACDKSPSESAKKLPGVIASLKKKVEK